MSRIGKSLGTKRLVIAKDQGLEADGEKLLMSTGFLFKVMKIF